MVSIWTTNTLSLLSSRFTHVLSQPAAQQLSINNLAQIIEELNNVTAKWCKIGVQLGVDDGRLDSIKQQYADPADRMRETLRIWLKDHPSPPTWSKVVKALRCRTVGETVLAESLEHKYHLTQDTNIAATHYPAPPVPAEVSSQNHEVTSTCEPGREGTDTSLDTTRTWKWLNECLNQCRDFWQSVVGLLQHLNKYHIQWKWWQVFIGLAVVICIVRAEEAMLGLGFVYIKGVAFLLVGMYGWYCSKMNEEKVKRLTLQRELQTEVKEKEKALKEEKDKSERLDSELKEEKDKSERLDSELKEEKDKSERLDSELKEEKDKSERLDSELKEEKDKSERLDSELKEEKDKSERLDSELKEEKDKSERLDSELKEEKDKSKRLGLEKQKKENELKKEKELWFFQRW